MKAVDDFSDRIPVEQRVMAGPDEFPGLRPNNRPPWGGIVRQQRAPPVFLQPLFPRSRDLRFRGQCGFHRGRDHDGRFVFPETKTRAQGCGVCHRGSPCGFHLVHGKSSGEVDFHLLHILTRVREARLAKHRGLQYGQRWVMGGRRHVFGNIGRARVIRAYGSIPVKGET